MRSKKLYFVLIFLLFFVITKTNLYSQKDTSHSNQNNIVQTETNKINENGQNGEHVDEEEDSHGGMEPLLFIIVALIIGAATRHFLKKTPIPYTVLLLIFGLLVGVFNRFGWLDGVFSLDKAVKWAGNIDPHTILFVFLPTLVFEAAFGMDVHTFKKSVTNSVILAVPGILVALVLTGVFAMGIKFAGIGLFEWTWAIAMMFGSVVSATDPVAVVSILKELGVNKKLSTLIDGESMLNDGTAIVFFMVFFVGIIGSATGSSPVMDFFVVSFGGILVGLVIGSITIAWVKNVFNDALVEISIIVVAAYLTFFVCENFLHVSGVLGLVTLGLMMASVGKTRISPPVHHFLNEFWELAAFIANTLIFIIVGVVIAQRTRFEPIDFLILFLIYIGITIIRAIMIAIFFPAMKKIGYGISKKDSVILLWGALRGAIALALALVIAGVDDKFISPEIKNQFLFLTAGLVTMTLLFNATTMKFVLNKLGFTKISPANALMIFNAKQYLRSSTENSISRLKNDRFMKNADWNSLYDYLPERPDNFDVKNLKIDTIAELRSRILENEKSTYWSLFEEGLIGPIAVQNLTDTIAEILDKGGMVPLSDRQDLEQLWKTSIFFKKLQNVPLLKHWARNVFFTKLSISYESAHGFVEAQEKALKLVESMYRSMDKDNKEEETLLNQIEEEINENKIHGLTYLRNLKKTYPEIYDSISTKQAIRTMLNYEHHTVERIVKNGRISSKEAEKMILNIEERMKKLINHPPKIELPDTYDLLEDVSWMKKLDKKTFKVIADNFETRLFAVDEKIIKEGEAPDSIYVISRGTVKVIKKNEVIAVLGQGETVGEMTVLNGLPRIAEVTAESPVTALRIKVSKIQKFIESNVDLRNELWTIAAYRFAMNILRDEELYKEIPKKIFDKYIYKGDVQNFSEDKEVDFKNKLAIILSGKAKSKNIIGLELKPIIIIKNEKITIEAGSYIYVNDIEI